MALFFTPKVAPMSGGNAYPACKLYFYATGTSTAATVYSDSGLTTAHASPVVADSGGVFAPIYVDSGTSYRVVLKTSGDVTLWDVDPFPAAFEDGAAVGELLWPRTATEIAASVTPSDYTVPSHDAAGSILVERYGFDASDSASDQSVALEAAYDVAVALDGGVIELPIADFRATISIEHARIRFRGQGGATGTTVWRNVGATAPVTFSNASRPIFGSGLEHIAIFNQNVATYTSTDGVVISSEATGVNQMDYLTFQDIHVYQFRDGVSVTGRMIYGKWDRVRCESSIRDGLSITGSDNFSQHKFTLCRFGNSGRHGVYADLDFSLTSTGVSFDTCTFEQNEELGIRITGDVGLSSWTFSNCYFEENAGSLAANSTAPRKAHVHVDSVYAMGLRFEGCTFYGNTAPDDDVDWAIYVDTSITVNVHGSVENCRVSDAVIGALYWPQSVFVGMNSFTGTSVWTPTLGSVALSDQNDLKTWTPGIAFGGGTTGLTYTTQVGRYLVHGKLVTATAYILINDNGSSTGAVTITGLPIAASNVTNLIPSGSISIDGAGGSLAAPLFARVVPNTTTISLHKLVTGTLTALGESDLVNGTAVSVTVSYFV